MDTDDPSVGLSISLGAELGEPSLRDCALIAVPYGGSGVTSASPGGVMSMRDGERARGGHDDGHDDGQALGVLGVIGPSRMDYGRVIPLVHECSQLVTRKLLG
jgi:transcriptional regulator of heat shock response